MPGNFVSINHLACEISQEQQKHRNFESLQFDCRNSRNFAYFGKFRLCMYVVYVCIFLAFHDFLKLFGNILVQLFAVAGALLCRK